MREKKTPISPVAILSSLCVVNNTVLSGIVLLIALYAQQHCANEVDTERLIARLYRSHLS